VPLCTTPSVFGYDELMGWGKGETRIEKLRAALSRDPAAVVEAITEELRTADRPRDQVRLLGLRATGYQRLAQYPAAQNDLKNAVRIPRCGGIAHAEIIGQLAAQLLATAIRQGNGWSSALATADENVITSRELAAKPSGHTTWAIRQARTRTTLLANALVVRGQVHLYGYGEITAAFADGVEALNIAPRYSRRRNGRRHPKIPACSLLAICATRGGTGQELEVAERLVKAIENELPITDTIPHAQIRATTACIKARQGDPITAEKLLLHSLDDLRRAGAWNLYGQILVALIWVVRDCQNRPERAQFLQSSLSDPSIKSPPI
jgi:hypothetical protein